MAPNVVNTIIQSSVSLKRIEKYLLEDELDPIAVVRGRHTPEVDEDTAIQIKDGSFFWKDDGEDILKNINLKVKKGSLVAVSTYRPLCQTLCFLLFVESDNFNEI
jgi:ABC-type multidrug transport system fused ATPase/permease subunit